MADNLTKEQRTYCMSRIRSKNTKAELFLKAVLKGSYLRYQPNIYGNPDFGSKKKRIAIFIDGCFWHKCPIHYIPPKSNAEYWTKKIERNVFRDGEIKSVLVKDGYKVVRIWEHECRDGIEALQYKVKTILS